MTEQGADLECRILGRSSERGVTEEKHRRRRRDRNQNRGRRLKGTKVGEAGKEGGRRELKFTKCNLRKGGESKRRGWSGWMEPWRARQIGKVRFPLQ